jgi:hypothetical protein
MFRQKLFRQKSLKRETFRPVALSIIALAVALTIARPVQAQDVKTAYPAMAPVEQYLMNKDAEIALARSAGPDSISKDAEVLVLGKHGYESAVKGSNGFVCLVERGWTAGLTSPDFWNPKLRGPLCVNAAAARSYLPLTFKKTEFALAGQSRTQVYESLTVALDKKEIPALEPGSMSYMLSKGGYLGDGNGHWRPHLMFFVPHTDAKVWGANEDASPIYAIDLPDDRLTIFLVPVAKWSDGTEDSSDHH